MKVLIVLAILIALTATQTVVTPKTQACACTNLLNSADCQAFSGCTWTATNSTNTTSTSGTCANLTSTSTTPVITTPAPTYCGSVLNATSACAGTFGCAYQNSTCQIFTGCSAYVQTTNTACQAISTQCTTDGTRCVLPGTCITYTTQTLCQGNIATSGARQCKWTAATGTTGTCGDMICTDAATSLNTLALCQAWISTCFSTGKGCVASLGLCSSYTIAAGCTGMIGSDGGCIANTASGSTACRPIACTDAPIATSTIAACGLFLTNCVTTGKGCVATLSACNTYASSLGCSGLLGNDGFCTPDTTAGAVNCRALLCTDAPASTTTDAACTIFKSGCQTTGQGCVTSRQLCSSYTGTTTSCVSYIGTDGNCKGTSATTAACAAKQCTDAPTTANTDSTCAAFQTGCVTTGLGCVASLGACSSYQGTASTCPQYKGNDGNCTALPAQTTAASCSVKACVDAGNQSTNSGCQSFSYKCVTNGTTCILPGSCETIATTISCSGTSTCNSGSQCLNRSTCVSYTTQSLCSLNQQQYVPPSSTTTYPRACTWGATCTNKICSDQLASLTTDLACAGALAGCVTTGAGCVDISAACTAYSGITATCAVFKGINGTKVCTQLTSQGTPASCIDRTCANASTASSVTQVSDSTCSGHLSTCYFNKNAGCTDGGCTSYFGTQAVCSAITTAVTGTTNQKCWQLLAVTGTTTACTIKVCSDSPNTNNTDALCAAFLTGCVTNGNGCVPNTNLCTQYTGNLTLCSAYNQNTNQQCSKTSQICRLKLCTDTVTSPSAANCSAYLSTCAFNGTACAVAAACTTYSLATFALCNATTDGAGNTCGWTTSGVACKAKVCTDAVPTPSAAICTAYGSTCAFNGTACAAAAACTTYSLATFALCNATTDGAGNACGWATAGVACKAKACSDAIPSPSAANCTAYMSTCSFNGSSCFSVNSCTSFALATFALCNATTDGSVTTCGWTTAGTACKLKLCTDPVTTPAAASCTAYMSTCAFNGTACAAAAACSTYALNTFALCNATTDGYGNACGWFTGGTACKAKGCTDIVPSPSAAICTAYISTCAFNGTACAAPAACTSYALTTFAACNATTDGAGNACGWFTGGTACKVKGCTDIVPSPSAAICTAYISTCAFNGTACAAAAACTSYALSTFLACSATTDGAGNGCGWFTGGTACKVRGCTDIVATPSAAICTAYLSTCAFNGTACAAAAACTSYALTSFADCNATTDGAGNACGWFTGGTACKVKGCTDIVPSPSAVICTAYISTCAFNGTACAAPAACTSYALTTFAACNATTDGAGNACGWFTGGTACKAKGCTDIVPSPSAVICTAYISTCAFNGTACAAAAACTSYALTTFAACNAATDGAGNACGWVTGGTACKVKACTDTLTTPSAANCSAYLSSCGFNGTACYSALLCSSYALTTFAACNAVIDGAGNTCGWATSGVACKAKACTDAIPNQSAATCTTYLSSCAFNGTTCVTQTACTSYNMSTYAACILTTDGAGGACGWTTSGTTCKARACTDAVPSPSAAICTAYLATCSYNGTACVVATACTTYASTSASTCNLLTDGAGNSCGWATSGIACKAKACTDVISTASAVNCNAYLTGCLFNGTSCVTAAACNTYVAQGATDALKSANCNALTGPTTGTKCTFVVGQANCQDTAACSTFVQTSLVNCLLSRDTAGLYCGFLVGDSACSAKACPQQLLEASCNDTWATGCIINTTSACAAKVCTLAPITSITNALCTSYRQGCVTNGAGCLESTASCSAYAGTQVTCLTMTGSDGPCNNVLAAVTATACVLKTCLANTTATSDSACAAWYPPTGLVKNCIWNGSTGCIVATTLCAGFTGTIDSCATFSASDSPCSGTGATAAACVTNSLACSKAPSSFSTHAQCQGWNTSCMTNGFGCISTSGVTCMMISSPTVCPLYKTTLNLGCDIANQCLTKPTACGGFVTAFDCNNVPIAGATTVNCAWNTQTNPATCISLTCNLLPVTLTSDSACFAMISTCTTNSAGCVTKGACSTYNKLACGPATTTDLQKVCIWANSACRPIVCSDNTSSTSDAVCNTYLTGCRTTGQGCSSSLTCSAFTSALFCQKDQNNNPCLWNRGACINYTKCTDVTSSSHTICQAVSPLCTTNGTTCFPITGCSVTTLLASCILGTDGNCGWLPANLAVVAQCALYTTCTLAQGTSTSQCLLWGSTCVSNGVSCIQKATCSSYVTQIACGNAGTDGTCFYVVPTGTATVGSCRLQLCTDATSATATSITSHTGCVAFAATTSCTTSGTGCISQSSCGSYGVSAGCVQGTDGVCFWATTTVAATATTLASSSSLCRLKQCADSLLTSSSSCSTSIAGVKCVSNGINCIPQSTCSTYTAREACLGSGSDGQCAFTPGSNTTLPNAGTCAQFTSCSSANSDSVTCGSRADACFFNSSTLNGTTTLSCSSHTCATKALGSTCQAIPSFDLSTYSICVLTGTVCAAGNPTSFTAAQCYGNSVRTYTWNPTTSACQSCTTQINNGTNNATNNTTVYGDLIRVLIAMSFMI